MANTITVPNEGKQWFAECVSGLVARSNLLTNGKIYLYTAIAGGWSATTTFANFTEPTYTSYAGQLLTVPAAGGIITGPQYDVTFANILFQPSNNTGLPQIILGYFCKSVDNGKILFGNAFSASFTFNTLADILTIAPPRLDFGQLV